MKRILLPLTLLVFVACNSNQDSATAEATVITTAVSESTPSDSVQVDGITSATSKPNQVSFNGTIVLPPQRQATVAITMGGIVRNTSLLPGQYVQKGTLLATLDNPDFINLQQSYLDSHAQTEYLKTEYERQKALSSEQAASQKKFQQSKADYLSMQSRLEAAAAQLSLLGVSPANLLKDGIQPLLQVKAPISGYVGSVNMNIGKYIQPGDALCDIIDKTSPMLCLTTYEKDVADMAAGNEVQFRVNGMGKTVFHAVIVSIGQQVDPVNRSLEVYARIKDANQQFRPGMYVTARIQK
ncbi:efflux RND transporter periplasmic adaptor subunit [Bacteroides oleiciplenus]|uniref:Efflux transporter, RND family, MFP subunit n=1 Tax=Bacteroides oleiciplenus YIT 12058 TaxID=742727 RepID=K9ENI5_9BACE|nr:efflux RND transporter periplasmic adaptor subunit [Bacteroides oleiciplenus]EKU92517.1 efflux transporter, RND family, MFP subunit [Bacteroides oleiciplenus YIT 12058]